MSDMAFNKERYEEILDELEIDLSKHPEFSYEAFEEWYVEMQTRRKKKNERQPGCEEA